MGIPISLSVIYVLVGRCAGLPMSGIAFPGHFLARCDLDDGFVVLDAFGAGRQLSLDDCKQLLRSTQRDATFRHHPRCWSFAPRTGASFSASSRNLKAAYLRKADLGRALAALDRMLLIAPDHPSVWRDRGLLYLKLGSYPHALSDLDRYQEIGPRTAPWPDSPRCWRPPL